jgi:hypothetical protein
VGSGYSLNNAVAYSGSSYISLQNSNTGNQPDTSPTYWALIAQIGASGADSGLFVSDITTNNVSTLAHGFAPKAPNDVTKFLNGTGAYSVIPTATGSVLGLVKPDNSTITISSGVISSVALDNGVMVKSTTNQTVAANTTVAFTFTTVVRDSSTFANLGANSDRVTVPSGRDGWYVVTGLATITNTFYSATQTHLFLTINGVTTYDINVSNSNTFQPALGISVVVYLNAADYVGLATYQNSSGSQTYNPATLSMVRVN